ncbi:MAG: hypothetical protein ACHQ9S_20410 [Candidatus Binatia bacterium]
MLAAICAREIAQRCGAATAHMNMAAAFAASTAQYIAALIAQRLAAAGRTDHLTHPARCVLELTAREWKRLGQDSGAQAAA